MVRALGDVVWITPDPKPEKFGVLFLPDEIRETMTYDDPAKGTKVKTLEPETRFSDFGKCLVGTVDAIGPGKREGGRLVPTRLKPGDKVLVPPNCGVELMFHGKQWLVMREKNVYMTLEGEKNDGYSYRKADL